MPSTPMWALSDIIPHIYDVDTGDLTDIEPGAIEVSALPPLPPGTFLEGIDIVVRARRPR